MIIFFFLKYHVIHKNMKQLNCFQHWYAVFSYSYQHMNDFWRSRDTEYRINDAENSALHLRSKLHL